MDTSIILIVCLLNLIFLICGYMIGSQKKIITLKTNQEIEYISQPLKPVEKETVIFDDTEEPAYTTDGKNIEYVRMKID